MSEQPSLIERLKQARIVQVLVVYLAASWGILQLVDTLMGMLGLPDWLGPVTVVLLGVGLLVVGATAWVQSLESTTKAEEAGERPTDWEVDAAGAIARLKSGQLPHLTWGRAIVGGVVALSLTIGAAGAYVLLKGGGGLIGPAAAGASGTPTAVAVLPFETQGAGAEVYGEGMVSLLTGNLEGLGGLRTINSGTIIARWHDAIGVTTSAELDDALRVAGGLNARYAVRGSVIDAGGQIRVSAEVFDVANGERLDGVRVEGPAADMLRLVDELTIELSNVFVGTRAEETRDGALRTTSLVALESYLRGEALFRQLRFSEAIEQFELAVAADPTFAHAWKGLADSWGWLSPADTVGVNAGRRAADLAGDLPARDRLLMTLDADLNEGNRASIADLRRHLQLHPDDAAAWNALVEFAVHASHLTMSPRSELRQALDRSVDLMPSFSPHYIHLAGLVIAEGTRPELDSLLARMRAVNPDDAALDSWGPIWDFHYGTQEERRAAELFLEDASPIEMNGMSLTALSTDAAWESLEGQRQYTREIILASFPHMFTALEVTAGLSPSEWTFVQGVDGAPGFVLWAILTGDTEVGRRMLSSVAPGAHHAQASAAAVLGVLAGDETLRDRGLAALPDTAWASPLGSAPFAVDPEQARRIVEAVTALVNENPDRAVEILDEVLRSDRYAALAVYLRGQAAWDLGDANEAIRYWDVLLRTAYRAPVRIGLARAYEAVGDTAAALEGYRGFLRMWDHADPTLPPVVEAREAVARLGG